MTRRGRPVPAIRSGAGRDLVFLATDVSTDHSAWAVYEVWGGGEPEAEETFLTAEGGNEASPRATRRWAPDHVHGDLAAGRIEVYAPRAAPTWFLGWIPPGKGASLDLSPLRAAPGEAQTLTVEVFATRIGPVALEASWGGSPSGRPASRARPAARASPGRSPRRRCRERARPSS